MKNKNLATLLAYMKTCKELVNIRMSLTYFNNNGIVFIVFNIFFAQNFQYTV